MSLEMPETSYREGEEVNGFTVRTVTPLAHMGSVAYEIDHRASGARILHVHNRDSENLFSVAFRTPPDDDTGLPHILEHSVLCGSEKFPVKDPFVAMTRMSMATFINAMTGSDYTVYPVASNVRRDLFNLADVYWDAVFHPRLTENTFKQEGHHLDFADRSDLESPLVVSGVVYNEMKGAYSSPERVVSQHLFGELLEDTPYRLSSGGDPEAMPDLDYEQFLAFYRKHYRPENAFVFLYGDIPTSDYLDFLHGRLAEFERAGIEVDLASQPRWSEPRVRDHVYPIGAGEAVERRTFHNLAWITGDSRDVTDMLRLGVLGELLLGSAAAPLHKALIDSKLGENLTASAFFSYGMESVFVVGLKGSEPERREAFEKVVFDTLEHCAQEGFADEDVAAAFHQFAYATLEISGRYPLLTAMNAYALWMHGVEPLAYLRAQETLDRIHEEVRNDPKLLPRLIRERLLDNPHRLSQTTRPDPSLLEEREAAFTDRMARIKSELSSDDLQKIAREAEALEAEQSQPNTPEALATLPQLRVSDLPRTPRAIPTRTERIGDRAELLRNDVFANGIHYFRASLDLSRLPVDLWDYLPLYGRCVVKMGAAGQDWEAISRREIATTGGIGFAPGASGDVTDPERMVLRGTFSLRALDGSLDGALSLLNDLLFELDLTDRDRLRDVIVQEKAMYRTQVSSSGNVYATRSASRGMGALGGVNDRLYGVTQPRLAQRLSDHFDDEVDALIAKLESIREHLGRAPEVLFSWTGPESGDARIASAAEAIAKQLGDPAPEVDAAAHRLDPVDGVGYAVPASVAFNALVFPAPHFADPRGGALSVAALLLARGHLWDEIRAKGGAYGVRCSWNGIGRWWVLSSYRDPRIDGTIDTFRGLGEYVRSAEWPQEEVERTIIAVAKEAERPIRPEGATRTALWRRLHRETDELRQERHRALLTVRAEDVRDAIVSVFDEGLPAARLAVVAGRPLLEAAQGLRVEDLLED